MSLPSLPELAALADQQHFHTHALAKALGMSRRTLYREFIDTLGQPPSVWLEQRRESRIVELLLAADARVGEVARAVGMAASALARWFLKKYGMTPRAFRKRAAVPKGTKNVPAGTTSQFVIVKVRVKSRRRSTTRRTPTQRRVKRRTRKRGRP